MFVVVLIFVLFMVGWCSPALPDPVDPMYDGATVPAANSLMCLPAIPLCYAAGATDLIMHKHAHTGL